MSEERVCAERVPLDLPEGWFIHGWRWTKHLGRFQKPGHPIVIYGFQNAPYEVCFPDAKPPFFAEVLDDAIKEAESYEGER